MQWGEDKNRNFKKYHYFKEFTVRRERLFMNRRNFISSAGIFGLMSQNLSLQPREEERFNRAYNLRLKAAQHQNSLPVTDIQEMDIQSQLAKRIECFTKGLPHNELGEVDIEAYRSLLNAIVSGDAQDFEKILLGGSVKLANPQAAYAYTLEGGDSHSYKIPPPPSFDSVETLYEIGELYWQALTRDVPFNRYETSPLIAESVYELSELLGHASGDAGAPRLGSSQNIFRSEIDGVNKGPFVSQFLYKDIPYGALTIPQKFHTALPGVNYLTTYNEWLSVQNGDKSDSISYDLLPRYVRNGRDLALYVHKDFSFQHFLNAGLILLGYGPEALDENNPYLKLSSQSGFCTFGGPSILDLITKVTNYSLYAAWYQKWAHHHKLRPEEFAGRVHNHKIGNAAYNIHDDLFQSSALNRIYRKYQTYLLPQAYPEGSPTHPAYPAGHAAIAGACVTALKAVFNENFVIPDPVLASDVGKSLLPYEGGELTVGGELNKLAWNIAVGRNFAGIHWRSDATGGLKLGEDVTISVLKDLKGTCNEPFAGYSFTKFDGTQITI